MKSGNLRVLVNNNLCEKLTSLLEVPITFDYLLLITTYSLTKCLKLH